MDQARDNAQVPVERRRLRSNIPYQAVEFYLRSLKEKTTFRAIALSDVNGLLLAGIGVAKELELLALWGALEPFEKERYAADVAAICCDGTCVAERLRINAVTEFCVTRIARAGDAAIEPMVQLGFDADLRRVLAPLATVAN